MMDENSQNKIKLLSILYNLYSGVNRPPSQARPFALNSDGSVVLSQDLLAILELERDKDFLEWTLKNISKL